MTARPGGGDPAVYSDPAPRRSTPPDHVYRDWLALARDEQSINERAATRRPARTSGDMYVNNERRDHLNRVRKLHEALAAEHGEYATTVEGHLAARPRVGGCGVTTYGGNFDEWCVACPDGATWPDTASSKAQGEDMLKNADELCGCEETPHVLVWREVPEWESA